MVVLSSLASALSVIPPHVLSSLVLEPRKADPQPLSLRFVFHSEGEENSKSHLQDKLNCETD